jgi:general secretion pathway protein L
LDAIYSPLAGFFRWWLGELAGCLPGRLRQRFGRARGSLLVDLTEGETLFYKMEAAGPRPIGSLAASDGETVDQAKAVRRMIRRAGLRANEATLRLPKEKVLRRMVELPAAAAENLHEVLGFEMDRHTPFKQGDVYFDQRIIGVNAQTERIKVDLAVVPRTIAERAIDQATAWGLEPRSVGIVGDAGEAEVPFSLYSLPTTANGGALLPRLNVVLALLAVALAAAMFYLTLDRKERLLAATEERLRAARAEAVQADDMKRQLEEMVASSHFLVERKRMRPTVTQLLDEVTRLLPDNTWVLQFGWRGERLVVSGYSGKASALIGLLEESAFFDEVSFSSPVTLDPKVGLDRFNLSAKVVEQGQT